MNRFEKEGQNGVRVQAALGEKQLLTELSEDFSLPDYQPEIKRLLRVRANLSPADKYIGAGRVECSGTVDYNILYTGNDGGLYCTNQSGEYRFQSPIELPADFEIGEGLLCDVESSVETATGRVAGPRRLNVKCRLRSNVRLYGTRVIGVGISGGEDLQMLHGETSSARLFFGTAEPISLGDEILLDDKERDLRVISAEGQVFVTEVSAGSGVVNCRGEVAVKLLCCREEGEGPGMIYPICRRIPFEGVIPTEGVEVNCECTVRGSCSDLHITVEEGRVLCETSVVLQSRAQRNETLPYVRDLYSTKRSCETSCKTVELSTALRCFNGNFSLNTALPLSEVGIRPELRVVDIQGSANCSEPTAERGKYYMAGSCRFCLILTDGEELSTQELEVPFKYETDGSQAVPACSSIAVEVINCRAKIDGERIGVDAELSVSAALRGADRVQILSEISFGEETEGRDAAYTVCYPGREDTLWSVARRYRCSVAELTARNSLADAPAADAADSLMGVKFLLV